MEQFPNKFEFSKNELDVLKFWNDNKIYEQQVEKNKSGPTFKFTDGPPFVNSDTLHHGHILVSSIKDSILRFMRMQGYNVLNKTGYDCHGLPTEMTVNKILGISTRQEIEEFGIDNYNNECRKIIEKFSGSWESIYNRIGRWMDFSDSYKTMDFSFMNSVWWTFNELYKKNLVYSGSRIMPYSIGCKTPLSNFEASQTYKELKCNSIWVKFKTIENPDTFFIVWTTTPWTLPSNLALCVNSSLKYIKVLNKKTNEYYIFAENSLRSIYNIPKKKTDDLPFTIIGEYLGKELVGTKYVPIFDYFKDESDKFFHVLSDDFVNATTGSGIVHLAPAFGEDDYWTCIKNNIISSQDIETFCPIDEDGKYTGKINDMVGICVLDADPVIIKKISDKLLKVQEITHSYPVCWRTDIPLIYRCVSSIFIKVTELKEELIENNKKINWIPENIGSGRFHQWLSSARDWCVSRNRFFGTPIPLWVSDDMEEIVCVGSAEELIKLSGIDININDIHREFVDNITIPSKMGKGVLRRVSPVFDCWFESGSVPYGQHGYPFKNGDMYKGVDATCNFVAEGLDQTRGWFYTQLVLSTATLNIPPFSNVICSGLILSETGEKFSKKLGNFLPINDVIEKYGVDSLRLYLIGSPAVEADSFKFKNEDVENITKKLYQLVNSCIFFIEHTNNFLKNNNFDPSSYSNSTNQMDKWILARISGILHVIDNCMNTFTIRKVTSHILEFIEDLVNWYLKFNRNRLRGRKCRGMDNNLVILEQQLSLSTLFRTLLLLSQIIAPFTPFLAETIYSKIKVLLPVSDSMNSVHLCDYPKKEDLLIDTEVEEKVKLLQNLCNIVRSLRDQTPHAKSIKVPLVKVTMIHNNKNYLDNIKEFERYLKEEINTLDVEYIQEITVIKFKPLPNHRNIGQRYNKKANKIKEVIANLNSDEIKKFYYDKDYVIAISVDDENITIDRDIMNVTVVLDYIPKANELVSINGELVTIINHEYNDLVKQLHICRLFVTTVQKMRKDTKYGPDSKKLHPWDVTKIFYDTDSLIINEVLTTYNENIKEDLIYDVLPQSFYNEEPIITMEEVDICGEIITITIADPLNILLLN